VDEIWNISDGARHALTQEKWQKLPQGAKTCCFFLLSVQRGLSATYPAPIATIFEITYVYHFPHVYTSEKFSNFCTVGFPGPKNSPKYGIQGKVFVIELQLKRNNCG